MDHSIISLHRRDWFIRVRPNIVRLLIDGLPRVFVESIGLFEVVLRQSLIIGDIRPFTDCTAASLSANLELHLHSFDDVHAILARGSFSQWLEFIALSRCIVQLVSGIGLSSQQRSSVEADRAPRCAHDVGLPHHRGLRRHDGSGA